MLLIIVALAACATLYAGPRASFAVQTFVYCATVFVTCMMLHGELVLMRPPPQRMTTFYLAVAYEKLGRSQDARPLWQQYQQLAPEGEWIALAREFGE